jgi:serine/threonine protein kinase
MLEESNDSSDPLDRIIDEYLSDLHENRHPILELYQSKYPTYAEQLAEFLPLVNSLHHNTSTNPTKTHYGNLKPGSILGHYEIIREIGRGGMGIVYQAKQHGLDRIVALKVLISNPTDNLSTQSKKHSRFLQEAKLCSRLIHPNIIPIIQHGSDQGYSFYSMQFIEGTSLGAIVSQWRQNPSESNSDSSRSSKAHWHQIAQWMHDAADALETAHQHRILHRDIKPSNLLVDLQNKIWLGDFGLAKDLNHDNQDSTGIGLGTLPYMSPEALVSHATEKSDIYGLSITLFELLARIPKYPKAIPEDPKFRDGHTFRHGRKLL